MFEPRAAGIDQHDAAITSGGGALDVPAQRIEHVGHRAATRHHLEELFFARQERLGPFEIVDVGHQYVPARDATIGVPERQHAHVKPAIDAVRAAHTLLDVVGLAAVDGTPPSRDRRRTIIGMQPVTHSPRLQIIEGRAEVVEELPVHALDIPGRRHDGHEGGNAVGERAIVAFLCAGGVLGALALVDIGIQAAPLDDLSGRVG